MKNAITNSNILEKFINFKDYVVRYRFVIFATAVAIILSFLFIRIYTMANAEPTPQQVAEIDTTKIIKIDEDSIQVIRQLESNNISVEALFEAGRTDPFSD